MTSSDISLFSPCPKHYLGAHQYFRYIQMGQVIHCGGAARDPKIHNLFQIADVDSGVIRWFNADLVTHIRPRAPGQ